MDRKELYEKVKEKNGLSIEEFDAQWQLEEKEIKERVAESGVQVSAEDLQKMVLQRVASFYQRDLITKGEVFVLYTLGLTSPSDFGARRKYEEAVRLFKEEPDRAVSQGFTDLDGNPIYQAPEWKKGEKISAADDFEAEKRQNVIAVGYAEKDNTKTFKQVFLTLQGSRNEVPLFSKVKVSAVPGNKSNEKTLYLSANKTTKFAVTPEQPKLEEVLPTIKSLFGDSLVDFQELDDYHMRNAENPERMVIIKCTVMDVNYTREGIRSNTLTLSDGEFDPEGKNLVTGWIDKNNSLECIPGASDVVVVGRTTQNKEGAISLDVYGVLAPPFFRPKKTKPLTPDKEGVL